MHRRQVIGAIMVLAATSLVASCYGPVYGPSGGPPPHAPAHGYRRKHLSGVDLVYRADLGVYVVVGYPYYFYEDRFYWYRDGRWLSKRDWKGGWQRARRIPPGLRNSLPRGKPGKQRHH